MDENQWISNVPSVIRNAENITKKFVDIVHLLFTQRRRHFGLKIEPTDAITMKISVMSTTMSQMYLNQTLDIQSVFYANK